MQDNIDKTILTDTRRIPDAAPQPVKTSGAPSAAAEPKTDTKTNTNTQTVRTLFCDIFQKDEISSECLSLGTDASPDFRHRLEMYEKRYKLEKRMASGGFGHIFLAEDRVLGRKVVVKSLKEEFLNNDLLMERFIAEAKLNAQLDHPSIVPLYSLNTDSRDGLHLAMQLIRGITLKEYLNRSRALQLENHYSQTRFSALVRERLEIFLHICDAIEYCHSRGIIHNDLKPDNVMIGRHGEVYVMDWGIARIEGEKNTGGNAGTPSYMAPERITDKVVSRRTDIFALGMILNELVTLRNPVTADRPEEVIRRICAGEYEPSTCIDPKRKIAPALRAVIEKARNPNPVMRYSSVQQLSADVRHYLFNEEVNAYPDSLFQKLMRYLYRHRKITFALIVLFTLLYAATIFYGIYKENRLTQTVNEIMYRNLRLQTNVERIGDEIDNRIIPLKEQAQSISGALAIEYNQKKDYPVNAPVFRNEDLLRGSGHRPPGLIHSSAYNGNEITLKTGALYKLSDTLSPEEIQLWANRFSALRNQHLASVLGSIYGSETGAEKSDVIKKFYEQGGTIRRIICIADDKLVYSFPGKYEEESAIRALLREGDILRQENGRELHWTAPHLDSSGHIVISCWYSIFNIRSRKIGSVGFEISYPDLLRPLYEQVEKEKGKTLYTLVDTEDRLIFSSHQNPSAPEAENNSLLFMVEHQPYHFPEILYRIREQKAPSQFSIHLGGVPYRISWTRIPSTNWLLIQHVAIADIGKIEAEQENDQRNALRQDLIRNMRSSGKKK